MSRIFMQYGAAFSFLAFSFLALSASPKRGLYFDKLFAGGPKFI